MLKVLMYSHDLSMSEYGPTHPFKPMRARLFYELLNRYNLIFEKDQKVIRPVPLDEELLYLFHTEEYIDLLKGAEKGGFSLEMLEAGIGTDDNPFFRNMLPLALQASGGTYQGAQMLFNNEARFVFNPVGGFHHAGRDHAEGFCYVNDIGIAIADLVLKGQRIAYIDIDAHHGNGVQDAFFATDKVLTISVHESGETLYPGTGFEQEIGTGAGKGYSVNVPLRAETDDEVYLYAFEAVVPPLVKAFQPDVVFASIGCDTHRLDPLAHMNLTSNGYLQAIRTINSISPKIMAMGAGGYNVHKTAALWTLAWAEFCGLEPVDQYAGLIGGMMFGPESHTGTLQDQAYNTEGRDREVCFDHARKAVALIKETIFPLHGLTA